MINSRQDQRSKTADVQSVVRHNVRLDRIVYLPIDDLHPYHRKLRKRAKGAIQALMASVSSFGIVSPILVDADGTIIAGEAIVEAAKGVGYTEVPTIRIDHLDEAEVRFLRIALNKLGESSSWDTIELGAEFGELIKVETELAYEVTGFSTIEIDNLLYSSTADAADDPDDVAGEVGEPGIAVNRLGDLWDLGDHRVLCGSSLNGENLALLMGGDRARMVLTDSPYNTKIDGHVSGLGKNKHREFVEASGEMSEDQFIDFQTASTGALAACCVDGALLYLFMDWRGQWAMMSGIRAAGLKLINMAVWVKSQGGMGSLYRSQHELCYVAKKGTVPHVNTVQLGRFGRNRTNTWFYPGVNSFGADRDELLAMHPTSKNVAMLADAIRDASHRGDIVLDGFLGSGSTLIAAERTGRACFGVELDPLYMDVIIRRWEKATDKRAALRGTRETFDEVAERRSGEARREVLADDKTPIVAPPVSPRPRTRAMA